MTTNRQAALIAAATLMSGSRKELRPNPLVEEVTYLSEKLLVWLDNDVRR